MTLDEILAEAMKLSVSEQRRLSALLQKAIRDAVTSEVRPLSDDKDTLEVEQLPDDGQL